MGMSTQVIFTAIYVDWSFYKLKYVYIFANFCQLMFVPLFSLPCLKLQPTNNLYPKCTPLCRAVRTMTSVVDVLLLLKPLFSDALLEKLFRLEELQSKQTEYGDSQNNRIILESEHLVWVRKQGLWPSRTSQNQFSLSRAESPNPFPAQLKGLAMEEVFPSGPLTFCWVTKSRLKRDRSRWRNSVANAQNSEAKPGPEPRSLVLGVKWLPLCRGSSWLFGFLGSARKAAPRTLLSPWFWSREFPWV